MHENRMTNEIVLFLVCMSLQLQAILLINDTVWHHPGSKPEAKQQLLASYLTYLYSVPPVYFNCRARFCYICCFIFHPCLLNLHSQPSHPFLSKYITIGV